MPAQVVPNSPSLSATRYAVVGTYSEEQGSRFVRHVALLREDISLEYGVNARVWQMGPPLVTGEVSRRATSSDPETAAHVVGWVGLDASERDAITDWLAQEEKYERPLDGRALWRQYSVSLDPNDQWQVDERGVRQYRRFSCASFVLCAYREGAMVELLNLATSATLPEVGLEILEKAYGDQVRHPRLRESIHLRGDAPWRVALAGYVVHAFNRPDARIRSSPHMVTGSQECEFPSSRPAGPKQSAESLAE